MSIVNFRPGSWTQAVRKSSSFSKLTPKERREKAARDSILRVDHAGELGANQIYAGQMAVLGIIIWQYL